MSVSPKPRLAFPALVALQLVAIGFLAWRMFDSDVRRTQAAIAPITRGSLSFPVESRLKYFYELRAGYDREAFTPAWLGYRPEYHYNADGLNDRFDYAIEKPVDTFRIITLGDSWTYGQFVSTKDNYSEVLEELLNDRRQCRSSQKFEVLNLGVPSYDIEYSAERFRLRGAKYDPDLVLWLLIRNDFDEITEYVWPRATQYRDELKAAGSAAITAAEQARRTWNPFSVPPADTELEIWQRAVLDQYAAYGGEAGVLRYQESALRSFGEGYRNPLVIFLHSYFNLPGQYAALVRRFTEFRPGTYFYESPLAFEGDRVLPDHHPSRIGHELIAEDLFDYLNLHRLVPCA